MLSSSKLQSEFKKKALAFCLFILSIFIVYGVYASSYEEVSKSTVTIVHENSLGTGFFIDKNLLVTNYHVVEDAEDGVVFLKTQGGIKDAGKVVVADAENDLAIIRTLRSDYTALEMGSDEGLKMGDEIFVIGSPEGLGRTLSKGIISAQRRGNRIQITAPISPGSSGSPVFSKDFKVIGISVSYMPEGQNLNFAIPVSKLQELIQKNKVALEGTEAEEAVRQSESNFDKELASYENKEDKNPEEMFYLGVAYYREENYQEAFYWFEKAAHQGDTESQYNLGLMYDKGEGITKDYQKAVYWYQKAADQGYARAQHNLGVMYENGEGVVKDYKKAFHLYEKAANKGLAAAQYNFGGVYYNGYGVAKDYKQALYWYQKAANQGDVFAQVNLGVMYAEGKGVIKDYKKAVYWFEKAANQGSVQAQVYLGIMYDEGKGVIKDYKKAVYWYKKSANQGSAQAQYNLALMCYYGEGIAKNYIEAYKWAILSKAQSNEDNEKINKFLDSLENAMTPAQIAKAQELANQFEVQEE